MAYKKRYGRRGRRVSKRRYRTTKRGYKRLAKKVAKVTKRIMPLVNRCYMQWAGAVQSSLVSDYAALNICQLNNYAYVFGTSTDDFNMRSIRIKSFKICNYVNLSNEEETIGFTYFIVSLKKRGTSLFNVSTGSLLGLTSGTHYAKSSAGMVMLNKEFFRIHAYKKFTLTNWGAQLNTGAAQSQYGADRRWSNKIHCNMVVTSPAGNALGMPSPQDPSQNYYLLMFNDNSGIDAEYPRWDFNILMNIESL